MRVLTAITEPEAISGILDCLNLPSRAPPPNHNAPEAIAL